MLRPRASAAGSISCFTRTTRRSGRRSPSRSACSSGSPRFSGCTPSSAWSSRSPSTSIGSRSCSGSTRTCPGSCRPTTRSPRCSARRSCGVDVPPGLLKDLRASLADASWGSSGTSRRSLTPLLWAYGLGSTIGALVLSRGRVSRLARDDRGPPAPRGSPSRIVNILINKALHRRDRPEVPGFPL